MKTMEEHIAFLEEKIRGYQFPETPANLYDPLRYFLELGGKRMRPTLTVLSAEIFGVSREEALPAALAIEFFHNFSLIHDDIMDEAPTRRGKPTVHTRWSRDVAILSGDVLLVEAYQQLQGYTDERLSGLLILFNQTAKEVCEGQQMDMDFEQQDTVSKERYLEMIRLKTSVLLGCALQFGAIVARADGSVQKELYRFGVEVGIGFQIQDDLLDLYADPEKFGKQVGGDILSNKKTLLMINALNLAEGKYVREVNELFQMDPTPEKVARARILFKEVGAVEETLYQMNSYYESALNRLNNLAKKGLEVNALRALSEKLMLRDF